MNRIDAIFSQLRPKGAKALIPFITAGDPDLQTTADLLVAFEAAGASICEIGFPFSDPIADGPVIQASMAYALGRGLSVQQIFEMVASVRPKLGMGLVAMVSYSIVHRLGLGEFLKSVREAGFDGLIIPDLPFEQARALSVGDKAARQGLVFSMLIAPTTPTDRAMRIARASSGFVYLLARAGITGERSQIPSDLPQRVERIRGVTQLPLAVGFGISNQDQVRQVVSVADAAIVGSAIVRRIIELRDEPSERLVSQVSRFVGLLAGGLAGSAYAAVP